jgi:alpha-glucosidase
MKRLFAASFMVLLLCVTGEAIDLSGLEKIGPVSSMARGPNFVTFNCRDNSQLRLVMLASDLIRVRAAYRKPLPERDHSWAIAKTSWEAVRWQVKEEADYIIIATDEIEARVRRSPLLIEFRDAKSGRAIDADHLPMMFDPKGTMIAATKTLGFDEHFYGLGEKAARLDKRRGQFTMWNSDTPGYVEGTDPIYQSLPFYIGWEKGEAYGIFFDNSYRTQFDFAAFSQEHITFSSEGGEMNYYFFWGPSIKKVLSRYSDLTGHMPLWPRWALGNQQSRYSYYPDRLAEEVVRRYREEDLPLDVLHLDIHYMNEYRVFTWDRERYPDPSGLMARLRQQGVRAVVIVDPGVKYQPPQPGARDETTRPELAPQNRSYFVFNQGLAKNYFMKRKNGDLYIGRVWPGESVFVDYTIGDARRWWGDLHRAYTDHGVAGIWTDMNEPADFIDQTGKKQMDVISYDEGEYSTHAKNRNVFALLMARATYEGLERLLTDQRPFVITRAAYAGIQRYSTMWTGDNNSTWDALALSLPMFQTLGLSGQPFVGADVGGFIGRSNGELLTRWYQVGFLTPFLRNHKAVDHYDHEPWRFGKYYTDIIRKYLKLRYRLMPFLYTELEEAHRTGVPVFRPLLLNYQQDTNTLNLDDQFMIGSHLLVAPILKPDLTGRRVYLPEGTWFDFWTGKKHTGGTMIHADAPLEIVPVFVSNGSIIAMGPEMNYIGEKPLDPITFTIYLDEGGQGATSLYEDDGISPAYERGVVRRTQITASKTGGRYKLNIAAPAGNYDPGRRNFVFLFKWAKGARRVTVDGRPLAATSADGNRSGWYSLSDGIAVRIADDGKAHQIEVR